MLAAVATYGGDNTVFGYACRMKMITNPPAEQIAAFFGVSGQFALFGGLRGRVFLASGLIFGVDLPTLNAVEDNSNSYIDGIARTLIDTRGRTWDNVLMKKFEPGEKVLQDARGFYIDYKAMLMGLQ